MVKAVTAQLVRKKERGTIEMKNRKVFLDGYVELKRDYFKGGRTKESFVVVNPQVGFIGVSVGCLELAKVNAPAGEVVNARIGIHNSKDKFIIVFDETGDFGTRRIGNSMLRFNSIGAVRKLIECGFKGHQRYEVHSPEENVIVVFKEA